MSVEFFGMFEGSPGESERFFGSSEGFYGMSVDVYGTSVGFFGKSEGVFGRSEEPVESAGRQVRLCQQTLGLLKHRPRGYRVQTSRERPPRDESAISAEAKCRARLSRKLSKLYQV